MPKDPKEYIKHIEDEYSYLISVSKNLTFEDFLNDETHLESIMLLFGMLSKIKSRTFIHKF